MKPETIFLIENEAWKDFISQAEISPVDKLSKADKRHLFDKWNMELISKYTEKYNISDIEFIRKIKEIFNMHFAETETSETLKILMESLDEISKIVDEEQER
jgi:hypothetical protein